jgi:glycosyltransferase involved in cell wall biosynthesis
MNAPVAAPWLSVIVPAYNEAVRIAPTLETIRDYLGAQSYAAELLVIDDGSDDGTFQVVCETARQWPLAMRAFRYQPNAGKGYALKYGVAQACGEYLLCCDADLSVPIDHTAAFLTRLVAGADVIIGSRKLPGAQIDVRQPWLRERLGAGFTRLVRWLIADVSDATCGFKAFRSAAARDLFARVRLADWSFDAEVLYLARALGYRLGEEPVRWRNRPGTKVRLRRDVLRALAGLSRIRLTAARGGYAQVVGLERRAETWTSAVAAGVAVTPRGA